MHNKDIHSDRLVRSQKKTDGHWLDKSRIILYSRALLFIQVIVALAILRVEFFIDTTTSISLIGNDFRVFWSASKLGLDGYGVYVYDINKLFPIQQSVTPSLVSAKSWQYWFYPPTFLLCILPLSLLSYFPSFILFNTTGIFLYLYVVRVIAPYKGVAVVALTFPAVLFTAVNGQNSFITASLAGLSLVLLDRRPILSGMLIGALIIKPHLAVLFVVALLCAKRWVALISATCTSLSLLIISLIIFSPDSGIAFLKNLHVAKSFSEHGLLPLNKMPTVFSSAMLIGTGINAANYLHYLVSLLAASIVAYIWKNPTQPYLRNSALIVGSLLISPHLFEYDLVWLAWPIAWMAVNGIENGWRKWERELLLLAWTSPLLGEVLSAASFQLVPFVLLILLYTVLQRVKFGHQQRKAGLEVVVE